jgi:hypothetical protein
MAEVQKLMLGVLIKKYIKLTFFLASGFSNRYEFGLPVAH